MSQLANLVRSFAREEDGATMVEYGVMIALIAAVCIVIITTLGTQVNTAFTTTSNALPAAG
jgi:pilus assembly protein Flp/PilA